MKKKVFISALSRNSPLPKILLGIGGQSNSVGQNTGTPPSYLQGIYSNSRIFQSGSLNPLQWGVNNQGVGEQRLQDFGIELNVSRLYKSDINLYKQAWGGTTLEEDWASGGGYRTSTINQMNAALSLEDLPVSYYWNQWENDVTENFQDNYSANLTGFFTELQSSIKPFNKIIIVRATTSAPGMAGLEDRVGVIQQAQEAFVSANSNAYLINQDDAVYNDGLHVTGEYQNILASRTLDILKL